MSFHLRCPYLSDGTWLHWSCNGRGSWAETGASWPPLTEPPSLLPSCSFQQRSKTGPTLKAWTLKAQWRRENGWDGSTRQWKKGLTRVRAGRGWKVVVCVDEKLFEQRYLKICLSLRDGLTVWQKEIKRWKGSNGLQRASDLSHHTDCRPNLFFLFLSSVCLPPFWSPHRNKNLTSNRTKFPYFY